MNQTRQEVKRTSPRSLEAGPTQHRFQYHDNDDLLVSALRPSHKDVNILPVRIRKLIFDEKISFG
jgi:hypothetical protein